MTPSMGPTTPRGFTSPGGHNGFETFTHTTTTGTHTTTTTERLPGGWDSGNAAWKSGLQSSNPVMNDSRATPSCAPKAGRQIADHRRVAAWHAVGTHGAAQQRLSEMRAWRRPPGFRADGDLSGPPYASDQRAPRAGCRGPPLAGQLSELKE